MLHEKTVQYDRRDGTAIGADAGSGQWTGNKRLKHVGVSLPRSSGEVRTGSSYSPAQGDQEDPCDMIVETDLENMGEDLDISSIAISDIRKALKNKGIYVLRPGFLEEPEQGHVYERLMLYRLRAHKLSKGDSDELDNETLKKELPDFIGTVSLFRLHIEVRKYFEGLEKKEDGSVDWYFDPEFSKFKYLSDYQRLVLKNRDEYLHWKNYRSNFTTYKMDQDYVTFCDEMSEKPQWLKDYIPNKGSDEWIEMETKGGEEALTLTTKFTELNFDLAHTAYKEHIWSLDHDYRLREGWGRIFFEIWRLVTEKKLDFTPALEEVSKMHLVGGRHDYSMRWAVDNTWSDLESKFDSCVKGIPHEAGNPFAEEWITKAVWKLPKKKMLHQYKKRKMEIAESIGLAQGY